MTHYFDRRNHWLIACKLTRAEVKNYKSVERDYSIAYQESQRVGQFVEATDSRNACGYLCETPDEYTKEQLKWD